MENLKHLCRVCLSKGEISLYSEIGIKDSIFDRLMTCSSIRICNKDGLPANICSQCLSELDSAYKFWKKCEKSEKRLKYCFGLNYVDIKDEVKICSEDEVTDSAIDHFVNDDALECGEEIKNGIILPPDCDKKSIVLIPKCEIIETTDNGSKTMKMTNKKREKSLKRKLPKDHKNDKTSDKKISIDKPKERDKIRKHMCTICGKTFLFHGNLLDHERVHSGDKPYVCNICNRRFAQAGHLMVHARTHSGVKPYQCEMCPRAFTVSHTLKKHLRTHTGEKPYPCTMCDKSFVTSYHLSNHFKRQHTGDKSFKCDWPHCQQGFVNTSEMKRHRARHDTR